MLFKDRKDAGQKIAQKLLEYQGQPNTWVLGLPRGGVVVASEVAKVLHLPLDILVVRKMGAPQCPEFAIGAVDEKGHALFNEEALVDLEISEAYKKEVLEKEKKEAQHRLELYRKNRPSLDLKNKIVILVDDGLATGATMRAAVYSAKAKKAKKIIVAIPGAAQSSLEKLKGEVDEIIYCEAPDSFGAVGSFYEHFEQTTDEEVMQLLK